MRFSVLALLALLFNCQPKHDVPITIELHDNWQFKKVSDTTWQSATVPGNVFSDLLDNDVIENPFIGNNEQKVQWVSGEDWEYKTTISVDEEILNRKHIGLHFEGLDTYASVFLNDSFILKTNNAFGDWTVDVKDFLKPENHLRILFESTSKQEAIEKEKLAYELPEGERIFTRKAQFQYGWDWGPKLNTSGIWRPITLEAWNDYKIEDIHIKQLSLDNSEAGLLIEMDNAEVSNQELTYDVFVNDSLYSEFKNLNPLMPNWIPLQIKKSKTLVAPQFWGTLFVRHQSCG